MRNSGVSAVVGIILILAVVSSILTVIAVYKLPVLEKRIEFRHESQLLSKLFDLQKAYLGNYSDSFELGAPNTLLLSTHEYSAFRVWCAGHEFLTYSSKSGSKHISGNLVGFNISIYPSRLPQVKASVTPFGAYIYQGGFNLTVLNNSEEFYTRSFTLSGNNVTVYIYNYNIYGKLNYTISGNGIVSVSITTAERSVHITNVTSIDFSITSGFGKFSRSVGNYNSTYNLTIVYRNCSVDVT